MKAKKREKLVAEAIAEVRAARRAKAWEIGEVAGYAATGASAEEVARELIDKADLRAVTAITMQVDYIGPNLEGGSFAGRLFLEG